MTTHDSAPAAPSRRAAVPDREEAVVARLRTLGTALDGEPSPQFRAATRARLVAMAAVRQPAPAPKPWIRRLFERADDRAPSVRRARLTAGLTGAAVAVTAFAGLVAVSSGAHPGDALYGIKRGTEQTQLALTSDSTRGRTLLGFASTRLHELQDMARSGFSAAPVAGTGAGGTNGAVLAAGPSSSLVLDTIATMNQQTTEGTYWVTTEAVRNHDPAALGDLSAWARTQSSGLRSLTPQLPQAAQTAAGQALALVDGIQTRSSALSTSLTCPSGPATAGADQLGPVPATCSVNPAIPGQGGTATGQQSGTSVATPPPGATTNGVPAPSVGGGLPGTGGSGTSGTPGGGISVPTLPTTPKSSGGGLPSLPSLPTVLPSIPGLPGLSAGASPSASTTSSSSPLVTTPSLPIQVCLPGITC